MASWVGVEGMEVGVVVAVALAVLVAPGVAVSPGVVALGAGVDVCVAVAVVAVVAVAVVTGVLVAFEQVLRNTEMSFVFSLAVNISRRPSWLKSPASTDTGLDPEASVKLTGDWKVPLPLPSRTETLSLA